MAFNHRAVYRSGYVRGQQAGSCKETFYNLSTKNIKTKQKILVEVYIVTERI